MQEKTKQHGYQRIQAIMSDLEEDLMPGDTGLQRSHALRSQLLLAEVALALDSIAHSYAAMLKIQQQREAKR